ncbi:MAG TPA: nucleotidyltransferase family protein [Pseudobacteroides sp.]|uniref:nucleotidyltransferase family protein n=1 Tax=Pseudobacteroides sp. TaxID=1968840 RepID=UPI002F93DB8C
MNPALDDLKYFLRKNAVTDSMLLNDIKRLELGTLLLDTVKQMDETLYLKSNIRILAQKNKNCIFEEEIYKIADAAEAAGIKAVFIKGLLLADDLYEKPEIRQSVDVDLLIEAHNMAPFLKILESLSYKPFDKKEGYQPWSFIEENIHTYKDKKHEEFYKEADFKGRKVGVLLELHMHILQPGIIKTNTSQLIERAVLRNKKGHNIWLLEMHDNVLLLFLHFYEHFIISFNNYCCSIETERTNIQSFHDIALLLDKYGSIISWDVMFERIKALKGCINLALAIHLFSGIYPGRVPDGFLKKLVSHGLDLSNPISKLCHHLISQLNPTDILYKDFDYLLKNMKPIEGNEVQQLLCPFKNNDGQNMGGLFLIDEFAENIENIYGTYISCGKKPISSSEGSGKGRVWWDPNRLYIHIKIYKKVLVFNGRVKNYHDQDGVEILMNNGKDLRHRHIVFNPQLEYDAVNMVIINGKTSCRMDEEGVKYKIVIHDDGYELEAGVPWQCLDVVPDVGLRFRFNVAINLCDEQTGKRRTRLSWAGKDNWWWDVDTYGELILTE